MDANEAGALVAGALNLAVALALLLWPSGEAPVGFGRVLRAAGAVAILTLVETFPLGAVGLDAFGHVRLAWIQVAAVVPLTGLGVLVARARGRRVARSVLATAVAGLAVLPFAFHAMVLGPRDLRLERATLTLDPLRAGSTPIRIGVLADLQTTRVTDFEREAVRRLLAEEPDLILIPGDVFQGDEDMLERALPGFQELLRSLHAPHGVFFVRGDIDHPRWFARLFDGSAIEVLNDEARELVIGERRLTLFGVDAPGDARGRLAAFEALPGARDVRVVFAHHPRAVMRLGEDTRVDLVVAGHTHGGQVVLPLFGPPFTLSPLPRRIAAGGLHRYRGNAVYVSRGLGMERGQAPRIRFRCPPEVTLLTLE